MKQDDASEHYITTMDWVILSLMLMTGGSVFVLACLWALRQLGII